MTLGENLKSLRKKAKLTQTQLSEKANISRSYLADVERDRYNPSVSTLNSIAAALGISISELIDEQKESILPDLSHREEKDIADELEKIINSLGEEDGYAHFGGRSVEEMDPEDKELLINSLQNSLRLARRLAKQKFTPNKYRK
ncbi:helix-turn-helix domain-containing protein [Metabacillus idriensis]|uniref:helix-turn-helix domain-containing protein n=1 Tax=Metabacillus idriensis TaxID=324768 RepID=UPI00174D98B7|nr:helix-turn-helix transcriptional regulator [Metabacillus idriensis]